MRSAYENRCALDTSVAWRNIHEKLFCLTEINFLLKIRKEIPVGITLLGARADVELRLVSLLQGGGVTFFGHVLLTADFPNTVCGGELYCLEER